MLPSQKWVCSHVLRFMITRAPAVLMIIDLCTDTGGGALFSHNIASISNSGSGNLTVNNYPGVLPACLADT